MRRATAPAARGGSPTGISIHALLAESDEPDPAADRIVSRISIHALLAESGISFFSSNSLNGNFYPRSPCGERLQWHPAASCPAGFLSTLSLRRATRQRYHAAPQRQYFYPRSPCGERRTGVPQRVVVSTISIHALLAESDMLTAVTSPEQFNFYPRSPCGERRLRIA